VELTFYGAILPTVAAERPIKKNKKQKATTHNGTVCVFRLPHNRHRQS